LLKLVRIEVLRLNDHERGQLVSPVDGMWYCDRILHTLMAQERVLNLAWLHADPSNLYLIVTTSVQYDVPTVGNLAHVTCPVEDAS